MYGLKLKIRTLEALQEAIETMNRYKEWYMITEDDGTKRPPNIIDDGEDAIVNYQAYEDAADYIATMAMNYGK